MTRKKVSEGVVVRFHDSHGKARPCIVLAVLESDDYVYAIEGTTQGHWQDAGTKVLLEVTPQSRICSRMGLSSSTSTFFYERKNALHLIPMASLMVSNKRAYSCPQAELRTLQTWAFRILREAPNDVAAQAGVNIIAASLGLPVDSLH